MEKPLRSMREKIVLLSQVPLEKRVARVAVLETETIDQIATLKTAQSQSDPGFDAYADALVIAELKARLDFLRGLKFDLVKTHPPSSRVWRSQSGSLRPSAPE